LGFLEARSLVTLGFDAPDEREIHEDDGREPDIDGTHRAAALPRPLQ
jgi:hypothetical protein